MPYTHRPAACSAGTRAPKFRASVENVPCSSTTGRASEVQAGSFTPARLPGRRPAGAADDDADVVVEVTVTDLDVAEAADPGVPLTVTAVAGGTGEAADGAD